MLKMVIEIQTNELIKNQKESTDRIVEAIDKMAKAIAGLNDDLIDMYNDKEVHR